MQGTRNPFNEAGWSTGVLLRLALRPDRALLVAALGTAAAILLPVASTLVLAGVAPRLSEGWIAYPGPDVTGPGSLDLHGSAPTLAVAASTTDPARMAYVVGDPLVAPGERLGMPRSGQQPQAADLPALLREDALLVHPDDLGPSRVVAALFDAPPAIAGAIVAPARGADAFELATAEALRTQGLALIALSVPAVCLVAYAFARQEVHRQRRRAATLSALGGHRLAIAILAGRMVLMAGVAGAVATLVGAALYAAGPPLFHPDDAPRLNLALAIAVPTLAAALGGLVAVWRGSRRQAEALRGSGSDVEDDVAIRMPFTLRPLLVGLRLVPVLLLAGGLFLADVGFPAAAARTPASLAGGEGEWVIGVEQGLVIGGGTSGAVADVAELDPRVEAIVAETILPTLLAGRPIVLRGGDWDALAGYHSLAVAGGGPPAADQVALGRRVAEREGWSVGDVLSVQGVARPEVRLLQVTAIVEADGLGADEAFVDAETGRALAGLDPGKVNVVRFRPETAEARAAVLQDPPNLVVPLVAIEPRNPVAGSVARVTVEVANLGVQDGTRTLTLRLNGQPLDTRDVFVPGHSRVRLSVPFVAPAGAIVVEVNPTSSGEASAGAQWTQEAAVAAGQEASFLLTGSDGAPLAGLEAALYRDLDAASADRDRLAQGVTDGAGRVRFVVEGPFAVATVAAPRTYLAGEALSPSSGVEVTHVWTVPGLVPLETQAVLYGRLENRGIAPASGEVPAKVGDLTIGSAPYDLKPGEALTVAFPLYIPQPVATVAVGNRTLAMASQAAAPNGTAGSEGTQPAPRPGSGIQSQVAERALGDARQALVGLGGCALVSTLAVVYLATQRTLAGRRHVVGLLGALGQDADRIRSRAAIEGAVLGALCIVALAIPVKLAFKAMAAWGPPVFAHALPDPIGPLFVLQAAAGFSAACAWAAYLAAGRPS